MTARYTKNNIIDLAEEHTEEERRTAINRLNKIIDFLNSDRAKLVLEWSDSNLSGNSGDFFLEKEMNINYEKEYNWKGHKYNLITAIFLALLLMTHEYDYIQKLLKGKYASEKEGEKWHKAMEKRIDKFQETWEKEGDDRKWEVIKINILSQLFRLTLLQINDKVIDEIDKEIKELMNNILSLPEDKKVEVYNRLKTKLNRELEEVVSQLDRWDEKLIYDMNRDQSQ